MLSKKVISMIIGSVLASTISVSAAQQDVSEAMASKKLEEVINIGDWNVLFITSDEHNAKLTGFAGDTTVKTPNMDKLAQEGTVMNCAYSASPVCAPTRASIITGLYASQHTQYGNTYQFPSSQKTWAHYFSERGYYTGLIGKAHANNDAYNMGYDYCMKDKALQKNPEPSYKDPDDKKLFDASPDYRLIGKVMIDINAGHDGAVLEQSIKFLNDNKDKKFFLHASFLLPHYPFNVPEQFYYMYNPDLIEMPELIPNDLEDDPLAKERYLKYQWNEISEKQNRLYRARYLGGISYIDYNVGKLVEEIEKLGLTRKTMIIYTSDHGDMAAEKGLWLKNLMFDGAARVPFVIKMPGVVPADVKNNNLFNHVDIFPTIAGLLNLEEGLPNMAGKNYADVIKGMQEGPEYTFTTDLNYAAGGRIMMARSAQYKFIVEYSDYILYDMKNDPNEITNLANNPEYFEILGKHKEALSNFLEKLKEPSDPNVR